MTNEVPSGLVIIFDNKVFMTTREGFKDEDGNASEFKGIEKIDHAFPGDDEANFDTAVEGSTGLKLNEILGNLVVEGATSISNAVVRPSTCVFRIERDDDNYFAARNLADLGNARGQQFGVFAVMEDSPNLITQHHVAREAIGPSGVSSSPIEYNDHLLTANLIPVYSSLTITQDEIASNDGAGSQDYGAGQP